MKKQIYRKNSFPSVYTWNNKVSFVKYEYDQKMAMYYVYSNIKGEVFGEIVVTKTNTGSFEFHCNFNEYLDMDRFSEQSFAVRDIQRGFDYIAKNLYNKAKLKYGKEFWGE